ncbi:MAG: CheB methylesterase domain-containing protein [Bacillota bacterium]|nr:CheB methylesterase domain-containing protein [Bacillota bacterium]
MSRCRLVVVGSSTGGPQTLVKLFSGLPGDFPAPVVVVQHMPRGFTASLAARLDSLSALSVAEAREGVIPRPGEVWVAPGGRHLLLGPKGELTFSDDPPLHGVKPAVDLALESAVAVFGGQMVAVILTGMGMDGARAALKLRQKGGFVMAQSEESSIVYGMPRAAVELGAAHISLDVEDMPGALLELLPPGTGWVHG